MLGPALPSLRTQVGASVERDQLRVRRAVDRLPRRCRRRRARASTAGYGHRLLAGALVVMAVGLLFVTRAGSIGVALRRVRRARARARVDRGREQHAADLGPQPDEPGGDQRAALRVRRRRVDLAVAREPLARARGAPCALAYVCVPRSRRCSRRRSSRPGRRPRRSTSTTTRVASTRRRDCSFAVAVFFALYVGIEVGFSGWIATYAQAVGLGGSGTGAALTAVFWAAFTVGPARSAW